MKTTLIYALMALIGFHVSVCVALEKNFLLYNKTQLYYEMAVRGTTITASTALECAVLCTRLFATCYSFIFNQLTYQCTPGSWLSPTPNMINLDGGDLYYADGYICDSAKGFMVRSSGTLKICLWLSSFSANYTDAISYCQALGSNLYAAQTLEKKDLLLGSLQNNTELWIGLDDLKDEGVFRWGVDDSVFKNSFPFFFQNNGDLYGDKDCVCFSPGSYPFDDQPCYQLKPFVCEIS